MSILCTCYMVFRVQPNAGPTIPFTKHDRHWGWFMSLGLPHYHKPSRYIIVHYDHPLSLSIITTKSYKIYELWLSIITIHCNSPTISDVRISSTISRLWSSHQVPWLPRSSMKPWLPWRYKGAVFSPGGCGLFIGGLCSSKCATFFTWNYKNYFFYMKSKKKLLRKSNPARKYPVYRKRNLAMVKLHCSRQCLWSTAPRRMPIHSPMTANGHNHTTYMMTGGWCVYDMVKNPHHKDSHLGLMTLASRLDEHGVDAAYRSLPCWCVKTWKTLWKIEFSQWYMIWKW